MKKQYYYKIHAECTMTDLKPIQKKKIFPLLAREKPMKSSETGHSEISKGKSFMGVLKYLVSSVEGNKMKLL